MIISDVVCKRVPSQEVKTLARYVENQVSEKPVLCVFFFFLPFHGISLTASVIIAINHVKDSHPV